MPNLLTPLQVADLLQRDRGIEVHVRTVRRWCADGTLKAIKPGHDWLVMAEALDGFEPPKRGRPKDAEKAER